MSNKRTTKIKLPDLKPITVLVAFLVALILALSIALTVFVVHDRTKHHQPEEEQTDELPDDEAKGPGGMEIEDDEDVDDPATPHVVFSVRALVAAELSEYPGAESVQEIKATVTPEGAEDAKFTWTLLKKNGGTSVSESIVKLEVSEDTLTATLVCYQAFSDVLELKATPENTEIQPKTRDVHYVQRYENMLVAQITHIASDISSPVLWTWDNETTAVIFQRNGAKTFQEFNEIYKVNESATNQSFVPAIFGTDVYTKQLTVSAFTVSVYATTSYTEKVTAANATVTIGTSEATATQLGQLNNFSKPKLDKEIYSDTLNGFALANLFGLNGSDDPDDFTTFMNAFHKEAPTASHTVDSGLRLVLKATINGQEQTKTVSLIFKGGTFGTFMTGFEIGSGDIDFGG